MLWKVFRGFSWERQPREFGWSFFVTRLRFCRHGLSCKVVNKYKITVNCHSPLGHKNEPIYRFTQFLIDGSDSVQISNNEERKKLKVLAISQTKPNKAKQRELLKEDWRMGNTPFTRKSFAGGRAIRGGSARKGYIFVRLQVYQRGQRVKKSVISVCRMTKKG